MKVLDVTEFYSERGGGVRSHLAQKSQAACQLGVAHVVVAPGPRDRDSDVMPAPRGANALARGGSARLIRIAGPALPYDPTYHLLWRMDKVRDLVLRERPDVLGVQSPYVAALAALRVPRSAFGVRVFAWHADFIDTYLRVMLERRSDARLASVVLEPLWAMVRAIARACDATLVASQWQADKLTSHGVPRVTRLPFGVERAVFHPRRRSEGRRRALLGPGREDWSLIVGVGRFAVEKRWDVVLDAFTRLRRSRSAVLVLFGDGPERARMERSVAGRDDVHLAGFERDRDALAEALASADALVHGCPYETFGLSIAEAMSCGLPAVVPDGGGAAEMVDAGSGEHYASLDAGACARALGRLFERDAGALRAGALAAAARVPDVQEQFARTFELYDDLLRERRAGTGRAR